MKKLKYFSIAVLVLSLLAIPAIAQQGKDRDNKGGANTGDNRADLVKSTNKTPSKGKDNDKNDTKGKRKGFTMGKHNEEPPDFLNGSSFHFMDGSGFALNCSLTLIINS